MHRDLPAPSKPIEIKERRDLLRPLKHKIDELELRIRRLEQEVADLRSQKYPTEKITPDTDPDGILLVDHSHEYHAEPKSHPILSETADQQSGQAPGLSPPSSKEKKRILPTGQKDRESLVGKYIVGALAALLIFIGAASFVAIVWHRISDEMKLAIIGVSGALLTALGLRMALKKPSPIASIVLGTGSGLVYICILSANLAFHFISHSSSTLLCALWTAFLMFSYRYTGLYFTVLIAYIGSFVNLCFELSLASTPSDMLLILFFVASVSIILIYTSHNSGKTKYGASILLASLNFAILLGADSLDAISNSENHLVAISCVVAIFILNNLMYRLAEREIIRYAHFVTTILSTLALSLLLSAHLSAELSNFRIHLIFFGAHLLQAIINHLKYRTLDGQLLPYYVLMIYFGSVLIVGDRLEIISGATIVMFLLLLKDRIKSSKKTWALSIFVLILDLLLFLSDLVFIEYEKTSVITLKALFLLLDTGLLMWMVHQHKNTRGILIRKILSLCIVIFHSYLITSLFVISLTWNDLYPGSQFALGHLVAVIVLCIIYRTNYFNTKDDLPEDRSIPFIFDPSYNGIYYMAGLLYILGIFWMADVVELTALKFILVLSTLAVAMLQTHIGLKTARIPRYLEIWSVTKYLIFTWCVLGTFSDLSFESVAYSVSGLILAVLAIMIGFKLRAQATRQFGLAITMLMVAKFIIVDLSGQNSMTRVLAFIIGGVLCFLISVIYNRLSRSE